MLAGIVSMASPSVSKDRAKVVLLGSGSPIPDPSSSGPAVAVVVNGQAYLFDAGPGVVRRAQAAAEQFRMTALDATNLSRLFLTHLHSDHTLGYPDLILTPWVVGRREALEVYGPKGTADMTDHLKRAYAADIQTRSEGLEGLDARSLQVNIHEIEGAGPVYRDANITVRAISVRHGSWGQAFGYAMDAAGRTIVISGDTAPAPEIAEACRGCDVLVHEVYSSDRLTLIRGTRAARYHASFHTSTVELARLAAAARPRLLVLYHQLYLGPPDPAALIEEIRRTYSGNVVSGRDLSVY